MIAGKRQSRVIFLIFVGIQSSFVEYTIHYERNEIPLIEKEISNENLYSENNIKENEKARPIPCEQKTVGDIDELIFPDDEPYYVSQR